MGGEERGGGGPEVEVVEGALLVAHVDEEGEEVDGREGAAREHLDERGKAVARGSHCCCAAWGGRAMGGCGVLFSVWRYGVKEERLWLWWWWLLVRHEAMSSGAGLGDSIPSLADVDGAYVCGRKGVLLGGFVGIDVCRIFAPWGQ